MLTLRNTSPALKVVFGLAAVLSLGACATASNSTFSCPAPDGFTCMSPAEVYEATNGDEIQSPVPAGKKQAKEQPATIIVQAPAAAAPVAVGPDRCCNPVLTGISVGANDTLSLARPTAAVAPTQNDAAVLNRQQTVRRNEVQEADAYRESAKIMRIYVSPWEDEVGDLHMGGHIYSEIEPRRWRVGQRVQDVQDTSFSLLKGQAAADSDVVASSEPDIGTTDGFKNPQR